VSYDEVRIDGKINSRMHVQ
jgi:hypothetical protein